MPIYEGVFEIALTAPDLPSQIAEARRKIDLHLARFSPPSPKSGKIQALQLRGINPLRYELSLVPRTVDGESRTIL